jgi:hypothetical protein
VKLRIWAASGVVTLLAGGGFGYVSRAPHEAIGRLACEFGIGGFGRGTVWLKVVPPASAPGEPTVSREYRLDMIWGAAQVHKTFRLSGPTYFAFKKGDWMSPGADVSISPPNATLSCGMGSPPGGASRIDLTGNDFRKPGRK